ncbi:hypothetical protein [Methylobacterium sp. R2-1]|uniref:hypothetical protein n=1 Tax=Methylobacterium sp. R2-1 TaxID=2587064 RepID=UPI0016220495|nr:hypothetical protein [Methylobacterium sp. R2-1]MBB2964921.1 hypothetical protein [Methylobacterium sp. R2-1]
MKGRAEARQAQAARAGSASSAVRSSATARRSRAVKDCIRAVARRLREPHGSILALLYRDPKDVRSRLVQALADEVERTVRGEIASLENELLAVRLGAARRTENELAEIEADLAGLKARLCPTASPTISPPTG